MSGVMPTFSFGSASNPETRESISTNNSNPEELTLYTEAYPSGNQDLSSCTGSEVRWMLSKHNMTIPEMLESCSRYGDFKTLKADLSVLMSYLPSDGPIVLDPEHLELLDGVSDSALRQHLEKTSITTIDLVHADLFHRICRWADVVVALEDEGVRFNYHSSTILYSYSTRRFTGETKVFLAHLSEVDKKDYSLTDPSEELLLSFHHLFAVYRCAYTNGKFLFTPQNHPLQGGIVSMLKGKEGEVVHSYMGKIRDLLNGLHLGAVPQNFKSNTAMTCLLLLKRRYSTFDKIPVMTVDGRAVNVKAVRTHYLKLWEDVVRAVAQVSNVKEATAFISDKSSFRIDALKYLISSRNYRNNHAAADAQTHRSFSVVPGTDVFDDNLDNIVKCMKLLTSLETGFPFTHVIVIGGSDSFVSVATHLGRKAALYDTTSYTVGSDVLSYVVDSIQSLTLAKIFEDTKFPREKTLLVLSKTIPVPEGIPGSPSEYGQNVDLYHWFCDLDHKHSLMKMFFPAVDTVPSFITKATRNKGFTLVDAGRWHNSECYVYLAGVPPGDSLEGNWKWGMTRRAFYMVRANEIRNSMIYNGVYTLNRPLATADKNLIQKSFTLWRLLYTTKLGAPAPTLEMKFSGLSFQEPGILPDLPDARDETPVASKVSKSGPKKSSSSGGKKKAARPAPPKRLAVDHVDEDEETPLKLAKPRRGQRT